MDESIQGSMFSYDAIKGTIIPLIDPRIPEGKLDSMLANPELDPREIDQLVAAWRKTFEFGRNEEKVELAYHRLALLATNPNISYYAYVNILNYIPSLIPDLASNAILPFWFLESDRSLPQLKKIGASAKALKMLRCAYDRIRHRNKTACEENV